MQVFKTVPGYDERTLVLQDDEGNLHDLMFCSCPNKYKKRFTTYIEENFALLDDAKTYALTLVKNGYAPIDISDVLDYLRGEAKLGTPAENFVDVYTLDKRDRDYLARKLAMSDPGLAGAFLLAPMKCKANCGYPDSQS